MSILFVGGDRLEQFYEYMGQYGYTDFRHWSGRKLKEKLKKIDKKPDLCVIFVNFVSHNFANMMRKECKKKNIPLICSERKWCHLQQKLVQKGIKPVCDNQCERCS